MAYADKSCDMKRVCLARGGHVQWEGVEIDDCYFVMSKRAGWGEFESALNLKKEDLFETIKEYNSDLEPEDEQLMLLYQDGEDCNWNVREDYIKKQLKEKKE